MALNRYIFKSFTEEKGIQYVEEDEDEEGLDPNLVTFKRFQNELARL